MLQSGNTPIAPSLLANVRQGPAQQRVDVQKAIERIGGDLQGKEKPKVTAIHKIGASSGMQKEFSGIRDNSPMKVDEKNGGEKKLN